MLEDMKGRNVLVIGASSGIGLAFANTARSDGANVVGVARREDLLWAQYFYPITADVTNAESMAKMAAEAADHLGSIDLMVFCVGLPGVISIDDLELDTMDVWQEMYATNVVGANLATAAVLPYLDKDGTVAFLSSKSVEEELPLIGAYTSSKAALDQSIKTWRREHPEHRFCRVVLSWVGPTEAGDHMGPRLGEAFNKWKHLGVPGGLLDTQDVAEALWEQFSVMLAHPQINFTELKMDTRFDGEPHEWWDMMEELF
jgi:NAD(P)-dependent dehydrogenase (short-subunit alcohol dehydrogenase family)